LDFLCRWESGRPVAASDVLECDFVDLERLGELSLTKGTREAILRVRARDFAQACLVYDDSL